MSTPSPNIMREHWNRFAREDAAFYIATSRDTWSEAAFHASGVELVRSALAWLGRTETPPPGARGRLLEIGCGLGRTTMHFAEHFDRVEGVDVSTEMIARAVARPRPEHVGFHATSGSDLALFDEASFDAVVSFLVFQHVPSEAVIAGYLREIARVLTPTGRAALQFDARPESLLVRAYKSLPDMLLPRVHRRYIRRYRRQPAWIRSTARAAGLTIIAEHNAGSAEHVFVFASSTSSGGSMGS